MGIFDADDFDNTPTRPDFEYIQPNAGTVYKVVRHKELVKVDAFVAELEVVDSTDGVHPVGTLISYMISFSNRKVRDASMREAKRYYGAVMGVDPDEVTSAEFTKSCETHSLDKDKNPIQVSEARSTGHVGRLVRGTAAMNEKGTYTKKSWYSCPQEIESDD